MMRCCCCSTLRDRLLPWLFDYDRLQRLAVVLIHIQIGCALVGSLGALYSGVQLINLSISLFALVAIESSSQSLGRTYAVLLFFAILVDISWFILFAHDIWNISSETHGASFNFSVKLTLAMQILGCFVRVSSSFDQKNCKVDDESRNYIADDGSRSAVETCQPIPLNGGSFQAINVQVLESVATKSRIENSTTKM